MCNHDLERLEMNNMLKSVEEIFGNISEEIKTELFPAISDEVTSSEAVESAVQTKSTITEYLTNAEKIAAELSVTKLMKHDMASKVEFLESLVASLKETEAYANAVGTNRSEAQKKINMGFGYLIGQSQTPKKARSILEKELNTAVESVESGMKIVAEIKSLIASNPSARDMLNEFIRTTESKIPEKQISRSIATSPAKKQSSKAKRSKRAFDDTQLVLMVTSKSGEYIDGLGFDKVGPLENSRSYPTIRQYLTDKEIESAKLQIKDGKRFSKKTTDYNLYVLESAEFNQRQTLRICFKNEKGDTKKIVTWRNAYGRAPEVLRDTLDHKEILSATQVAKSGKIYRASSEEYAKIEIMSEFTFENQ